MTLPSTAVETAATHGCSQEEWELRVQLVVSLIISVGAS